MVRNVIIYIKLSWTSKFIENLRINKQIQLHLLLQLNYASCMIRSFLEEYKNCYPFQAKVALFNLRQIW